MGCATARFLIRGPALSFLLVLSVRFEQFDTGSEEGFVSCFILADFFYLCTANYFAVCVLVRIFVISVIGLSSSRSAYGSSEQPQIDLSLGTCSLALPTNLRLSLCDPYVNFLLDQAKAI